MKKNFIASGCFIGSEIKKTKNTLYIQKNKLEKIFLNKFFIEDFELIYCTDAKDISLKSEQKFSVMIYYKNGQRSLLELNAKFYNLLLKELS